MPIAELDPSERSKAAFWRMINISRERGWVSMEDITQWGEWELLAFDMVATAMFYPIGALKARELLKQALFDKQITAEHLLKNIERLLRDFWSKEPGKADKFLRYLLTNADGPTD